MKIVVLVILILGLLFQFIPVVLADEGLIGGVASPGADLSIENPPPVEPFAEEIKVKAEADQDRAPVIMTGPVTVLDGNA